MFRVVITVMGAGMALIGVDALIRGADAIPATESAPARIDSEVRFFAAWYVVAGALLLLAALRRLDQRPIVLAVGAGFFLAACGRTLSWMTVGRPEIFQIVLLFVELAIAFVLIPWQLVPARQSSSLPKKNENEPR